MKRLLLSQFTHLWMLLVLSVSAVHAADREAASGDQVAPASGDQVAPASGDQAVVPGHSFHGEAFNEGARQAARRMTGLATIEFPTAAKNAEAQAFVEQGIAQLHGFWYLEAERSFRQAAAIEKQLAIAYWGCAMANINNRERAKGFIAEAMKNLDSPTTRREKLYIESFDRYLKASSAPDAKQTDAEKKEAKQKTHANYIADLEKIIDEFPSDLEAKAFLVLQLWWADSDGLKMPSRYAVSALLDGIFAVAPMHPAHHYRIHLWDGSRPKNALDSAAKAGPSMPAVAHMWHMPGHTYSKLFRYADAVWQQEASARVDHAHMIESQLLPDQIHNFAHNNEWMIRNLSHLGRVQDAVRHSKHLIDLPQHPKFNTYKKGSFRFGRERLLQTLASFALWQSLIDEGSGPYLANTGIDEADQDRDAWLAVAHFMLGNRAEGSSRLRRLQRLKLDLQTAQLDAADADATQAETTPTATSEASDAGKDDADKSDADKSDDDKSDDDKSDDDKSDDDKDDEKTVKDQSPNKARGDSIKRLQRLIARVAAAAASKRGDKEALARHAKTAKLDPLMLAQWSLIAKDFDVAQKLAEQAVKSGTHEVRPLAVLIDTLWQRDKKDEAVKRFAELRKIAHDADLETPLLTSIAAVVSHAKIEGDWRIPRALPADIGPRPQWSELGPESWQPTVAMPFEVTAADGTTTTSDHWDGKPRVVFFYLGFGCLHCVEQLKAFTPMIDKFRELGIEVLAISNEDTATLSKGIEAFGEPLPIQLFSDPQHTAFKAYRCWDDFESIPLHGTFLIDGAGRVRWQDSGAEPFNDATFLLSEARRLLAMPTKGSAD